MKKSILIIFAIVVIAVAIIGVRYYSYKIEYNSILKENADYEQYKDKEIYGIELGTLINRTIDKNSKNKTSNEENSVEIEIYMQDNEQTYKMETFYDAGMQKFIQYYGKIKFKCSKIEYNNNTGKIKYLLFEQIATS